jgi:Mrp family chromosome partitioning ATPase
VADSEFAEILAEDLKRIGIQTWVAGTDVEDVHWATGVHPALVECKNMIVVLTPLAIKATNVQEALQFFVAHRKPIVVVLLQPTDLPDELRRKPRFNFGGDDYKQRFRELVQALTTA